MECELKDVNDFYDPKTFTDIDPESLKDMDTDLSLNNFVQESKNIELVEHKIKNAPSIWHNIKPKYLATVEGMMKKFFRTEIFKLRNEEGEYQVKLKLILTETGIWPKLPCFLNQTILRFAKSAALVKLGLVHAAIQLGPYLIDWTRDADLVSIRPIKSEKAMVVADLDKGLLYKGRDVRQVEKVLRLLCSKMVYWNVHRTFSFNKRNCQVFTTDILKAVGCDYKFSCKIDEYFKFLSKVGYSSERIFSNPIDSTEEKFLTHKQLDDYVNKILENHPNFEEDFPSEWDLLKSFDRAFWVGYVNVDDPKKENLPSSECPFSNPLLTASFLPYKLEFSGDLMLPREK